MNVQCVLCKEIVDIGDFRSSNSGIEITCSACGGTYSVDAVRSSAPRSPEAGEVACPKCGQPAPEDLAACATCGLVRERFDGFESSQGSHAPDALAELWESCRDSWDDLEAHDRFIKAAMVAEAYRYAAARYRQALRENRDDPIARSGLDDVARRAETAILQSASAGRYEDDHKQPYKSVTLLLVVLVALIAMGMVYAVAIRDEPTQGTRVTPAKSMNVPVKLERKRGARR